MLAADSGTYFPLQGILWTIVLFFGLGLPVWLLVGSSWDVFGREDPKTGERVARTVLVFVCPLLGSLACLVTRSRDVGELSLRRLGGTSRA